VCEDEIGVIGWGERPAATYDPRTDSVTAHLPVLSASRELGGPDLLHDEEAIFELLIHEAVHAADARRVGALYRQQIEGHYDLRQVARILLEGHAQIVTRSSSRVRPPRPGVRALGGGD
jgi:hypothetical protein